MRGDELDLRKPLGRYACEAAVETASNAGITSTLGVPFVGTIDFPSGRLTWCKDNPTSASDVKSALAFVRLSRECTAARGPVFGSGYLIEPRRSTGGALDATGDTRPDGHARHDRHRHRRVRALAEAENARFVAERPRSMELQERARRSMPRGVPMAWMDDLYEHPPVWVVARRGRLLHRRRRQPSTSTCTWLT